MSDLPQTLKPQAADHAATLLQMVTNAVGGPAGAFFGMLIGKTIPNQLNERLLKYVARTRDELDTLGVRFEDLHGQLTELQVDVFSQGAAAAGRATSSERIAQIATVVAHGVTADQQAAADADRLLRLLEDLSEDDVIALCAFTESYRETPGWLDRHPRAAQIVARNPPGPTIQERAVFPSGLSPAEESETFMLDLQLSRLATMGLIKERPTPTSLGVTPKQPYELAPLGGFFLTKVGALPRAKAP